MVPAEALVVLLTYRDIDENMSSLMFYSICEILQVKFLESLMVLGAIQRD